MESVNVLYDSQHYYLAEFANCDGLGLVDKAAGRGAFFAGRVGLILRASVLQLVSGGPEEQSVDAFLENYEALLTNPLVLH